MNNNDTREEFSVNGEELLKKVKELIAAGNARRLIIKSDAGTTILEIPLTVGVIGAVILPILAAVGAIAALVTKCTIVVEKRRSSEGGVRTAESCEDEEEGKNLQS